MYFEDNSSIIFAVGRKEDVLNTIHKKSIVNRCFFCAPNFDRI